MPIYNSLYFLYCVDMSKLDIHNAKQSAKRYERAVKLLELKKSGMSVAQIAKQKRVTRARIYYLLASLKEQS